MNEHTWTPPIWDPDDLDPRDWDWLRRWGAQAATDIAGHLQALANGPAWRPMPAEVSGRFTRALSWNGTGIETAYREVLRDVAPYVLGNTHGRSWGWVHGSGVPVGVLAEFLTAGLNANCTGHHHSPAFVELEALGWLKQMLDYPNEASGILVSGASIANLIGLAVARNARAGWDVRKLGLAGGPRLIMYASVEVHSCIQKAVEALGLGTDALVRIPADGEYRLDIGALAERIAQDKAVGHRPIAVVATAGTVNTGAIDPLDEIADLCAAEGLWMHIDGAFGALAWLDQRQRPALAGLQRADSLALDCHKWLYLPYGVGCVFVRDAQAHEAAFAVAPAYLSATREGLPGGPFSFPDYGLELSRPFRALKLWLALRCHGLKPFAEAVARNIDQAAYLARSIGVRQELELAAPVPLNVVCFRYRRAGLSEAALDALNAKILKTLQDSGKATPSMTKLEGKFLIRAAITNHRASFEDCDILVNAVVGLGDDLAGEFEAA